MRPEFRFHDSSDSVSETSWVFAIVAYDDLELRHVKLHSISTSQTTRMTLQTSSPSAQALRHCSMLCRFWCWMSVTDCCRIRCKRLHLMLGWKLHLWPVDPSNARQCINCINLWSTLKVTPVLVLGRPKHNMTVWFPTSIPGPLRPLSKTSWSSYHARLSARLSYYLPRSLMRCFGGIVVSLKGLQETGRNGGIILRFVHF